MKFKIGDKVTLCHEYYADRLIIVLDGNCCIEKGTIFEIINIYGQDIMLKSDRQTIRANVNYIRLFENQKEKNMKFEIYQNRADEERLVRLRLVNRADGGITVQAVDENGEGIDCLVTFGASGSPRRLVLHSGVNPDFGFDLDDDGRINIA